MWHRFTASAKTAVFRAMEEARERGAPTVAPQHLLLGVVGQSGNAAGRVLEHLGVPVGLLQAEASGRTEHPTPGGPQTGEMRLSASGFTVVTAAFEEMRMLGTAVIGTQHLLLGLARGGDTGPMLTKAGADRDSILSALTALALAED